MNSPHSFNKLKHKQVILLVDNRIEAQTNAISKMVDFRGSAFKQTEVDPLESRPDFTYINEEDIMIIDLKKKVQDLQKRVIKLQAQANKDQDSIKSPQQQARKKRRKFTQLARDFKCCQFSCQKVFASETSLKNHIKIKHSLKI